MTNRSGCDVLNRLLRNSKKTAVPPTAGSQCGRASSVRLNCATRESEPKRRPFGAVSNSSICTIPGRMTCEGKLPRHERNKVRPMPRFLVGIDLGTTNSALGYVDLEVPRAAGVPNIEHFSIPQLVAPGETSQRSLLPSFLYLPGPHDLPAGTAAVAWDNAKAEHEAASLRGLVGEFARNHGSRIPGRLVTSAKSWLCHAGVDRSAPLLPWSAPPDVPRISPVEASMRFLRHMVDAWNYTMAGRNPEYCLEKQAVVLTVPASFDDMARTLTVEAAKKAGLENLTLLEEPQAAFYCWLATHSAQEAAQLKPGDHCLVIDVG